MIDINLLPYEKRTSRAFIHFIMVFTTVCVIALAALFWYAWQLNGTLQDVHQQESIWKARALKEQDTSGTPNAEQAVRQVRQSQPDVYHALTSLNQRLPDGGAIQNVTFASHRVTVQSLLPDFQAVVQFTDRLRRQPFEKVETTQISQTGDQSDTLQITLTMNISKEKDQKP